MRLLLLLILAVGVGSAHAAGTANYRRPSHGIGQPAYYGEVRNGQVFLYRVGPKPYKPYDYRELMGRPNTRSKR